MASDETHTRPPVEEVKAAYHHLFHSGLSLSKIKDAALGGRLFDTPDDSNGVPGRSISWKIFLTRPQPLHPPPEEPPLAHIYIESHRSARARYTALLLEKMRAPDGSYEDGFRAPGTDLPPQRAGGGASNLEKNNPLSLHDENPWKEWFAAMELRKTISQDVERTFPDIPYFRSPVVQAQLMNVLFLYSVMHPAIGYRQGMHELLAPLYYALDHDSLSDEDVRDNSVDAELAEMCARRWVAADAWVLFESVMHGAGKWYEWRETPEGMQAAAPGYVHLNAPDGQIRVEPYVAPILRSCNRIQKELLRSVDPVLWEHMHEEGIEPQIYGIRWLRLIFTREFNMHDAMILWDGLFAVDPSFELAHWICVAMLVRIRNRLIPSDYSAQLTYLLRYPTPPTTVFQPPTTPHHATLLLRQAIALQLSPTPAAGAAIVFENHNLLNIPAEVPEAPAPPPRKMNRPGDAQRRQKNASGSDLPGTGPRRNGHGRQQSSQAGLPEMIAKGLMDRGEALGINKTFMNAVTEIRRNIPDLAANLVRSPPAHSTSFAAYPLLDERPPEERPPWEPRTRFEMERDVSQMSALQKQMGQSVSYIVDTLLQDEGENTPQDELKKIQARKREALESLAYVRDVLLGSVTDIEEERLFGEEEFKRRKQKAEEEIAAARATFQRRPHDGAIISPPPPSQPAPLPALAHNRSNFQPQAPAQALHSPTRSAFNAPRIDPPKGLASSLSAPSSGAPPVNTPARAPWNYTRSDFSTNRPSGFAVPTLAAPPRASRASPQPMAPSYPPPIPAARQNSRAQNPQGGGQDPLGVL
ncbi:hypothetical protein DENSPDRAFT_819379 [Dentipellis sp. KUC8613]|nr:hypothetical protein DENSPDRAFT_819379 [Dentipellis sp. KUC8613]